MTGTTKVQTPTFAQLIQDIIENRLCDVHTSLPAKIISYNAGTGYASVQILIKRKFKNEDSAIDLPVINSVPVLFQRTANSFIHMPVAKDDVGHLLFSERSLDRWKTFGGSQDPQDPRKHDLSDAVFLLGGYPKTSTLSGVVAGALHIKNANAEIIIKSDNEIEVKNETGSFVVNASGKFKLQGATAELITKLIEWIDLDIAHAHPTAVGLSGPPSNATDMTLIKTDLESLKI